jgi:hypothetical protein
MPVKKVILAGKRQLFGGSGLNFPRPLYIHPGSRKVYKGSGEGGILQGTEGWKCEGAVTDEGKAGEGGKYK